MMYGPTLISIALQLFILVGLLAVIDRVAYPRRRNPWVRIPATLLGVAAAVPLAYGLAYTAAGK